MADNKQGDPELAPASQSESSADSHQILRCPKCGDNLCQVTIAEVPIEECKQCLGIWLDAGELELIGRREYGSESWLSKVWRAITGKKA